MNSTALLLTGLGWYKKAASLARIGELMLSICAVTNLSLEEVTEKTKGKNLDVILKAAALTGECTSYGDACRINLGHTLMVYSTKLSAPNFQSLAHQPRKRILSDRAKHFWQNRTDNSRRV